MLLLECNLVHRLDSDILFLQNIARRKILRYIFGNLKKCHRTGMPMKKYQESQMAYGTADKAS